MMAFSDRSVIRGANSAEQLASPPMSPAPPEGGGRAQEGRPSRTSVVAQLDLEEEQEDSLRLRIFAVRGLRSDRDTDRLNPYVVVRFGFSEQRTTTLQGTTEPRWEDDDHELVFPIRGGAEAIEVEVLHERSVFESATLGRADIATWGMTTNQWLRRRSRLKDTVGGAVAELEYEVCLDVLPSDSRVAEAQFGTSTSSDRRRRPQDLMHDIAAAEAELAAKSNELQSHRQAVASQAEQRQMQLMSARKGELPGGLSRSRADLESQSARQRQRLQDLQDCLAQRRARMAELQQTVAIGAEANVGVTNGVSGKASDAKWSISDLDGMLAKDVNGVAGVWQARVAALTEELRSKTEKTQALRTREQQMEAELRSQLHEDQPRVTELASFAIEMRQAFTRRRVDSQRLNAQLQLDSQRLNAQLQSLSVTPLAATATAPLQSCQPFGLGTNTSTSSLSPGKAVVAGSRASSPNARVAQAFNGSQGVCSVAMPQAVDISAGSIQIPTGLLSRPSPLGVEGNASVVTPQDVPAANPASPRMLMQRGIIQAPRLQPLQPSYQKPPAPMEAVVVSDGNAGARRVADSASAPQLQAIQLRPAVTAPWEESSVMAPVGAASPRRLMHSPRGAPQAVVNVMPVPRRSLTPPAARSGIATPTLSPRLAPAWNAAPLPFQSVSVPIGSISAPGNAAVHAFQIGERSNAGQTQILTGVTPMREIEPPRGSYGRSVTPPHGYRW